MRKAELVNRGCLRLAHLLRLLLVVTILAATSIGQTSPQNALIDIRRLMTAAEFKDAGLDKLSSGELAALNQWVSRFTIQIQNAQKNVGDCQSVIESEIDGTFNGWSGETVFKLTNGQIWQQSSYDYTYEYAYRPEVMIFPSGGRCRMKVEDVSDTIEVKRLK